MQKIDQAAIKRLLELEDNVTLSIYMPTHRYPTSDHINEDKIRFKNLMRDGKEALESSGVDDGLVRQLISQLETTLYEDDNFWQHTTEGLAVFCSAAGIRYFHLPMECDEYLHVGDRFDIAPLLAVAACNKEYYLLALAVHRPVLYKGDIYELERVTIDLPESPEAALGIDELYSNSQTARSGGYGAGNPGAKSHGQGDSRQAGQEERLKFFRIIDETIHDSGSVDANAPFLLAGTDDDISSFRESSKLKTILTATLGGNYTETPVHDAHGRAWPIVGKEFCEAEVASEIEKVRSLLGTGKASTDPEDIATAASQGRVDTLLVGMMTITRDTVNDSKDPARRLLLAGRYKNQRVSACGRAVFDQGGKVCAALESDMPEQAILAAVYRY